MGEKPEEESKEGGEMEYNTFEGGAGEEAVADEAEAEDDLNKAEAELAEM